MINWDPEGNDCKFGRIYERISQIKVKVKLPLCLTKHHAMKTYWGVDV